MPQFLKLYLKSELSPGVISLYTMRSIMQVASGLVGLFLPVYLYLHYNMNLILVFAYYLASFSIFLFIIPFGGNCINWFGLKRSLAYSIPFRALFFLCFYFFENNVFLFTVLTLISVNLFRILHWIPYHADFAKFTDKKNRGKQISFLVSLTTLVSIFIPITAGFLVSQIGWKSLFAIVVLLDLVAMIPLYFVPHTGERFSWTYRQTWKHAFMSENRNMLRAFMADGVQNIIGLTAWPVFIWLILQGDFLKVGTISSAVVLVTVILRLVMGEFTDRYDKKKLIRFGTIMYSLGWGIKVFVSTGFQIFIASTYHNFATIIMRTPFDTLMYEKMADSGHYVDEYSTVRQIYVTSGKVLALIAMIILLQFTTISMTFFIALIASLFLNFLPTKGLEGVNARPIV